MSSILIPAINKYPILLLLYIVVEKFYTRTYRGCKIEYIITAGIRIDIIYNDVET